MSANCTSLSKHSFSQLFFQVKMVFMAKAAVITLMLTPEAAAVPRAAQTGRVLLPVSSRRVLKRCVLTGEI